MACSAPQHPPAPATTVASQPTTASAATDVPVTETPTGMAFPACRSDLAAVDIPNMERGGDRFPTPAADATPALVAECARLARQADLWYARPNPPNTDWASFYGAGLLGRCLPAGRGAWVFEGTARVQARCGNERCKRTTWRLAYVTPAARHVVSAVHGVLEEYEGHELRPEVRWLGDIDHDGIGEISVRELHDYHEEETTAQTASLRVHNAAVEPIDDAWASRVTVLLDVDHDGNADTIAHSPFRVPTPGLTGNETTDGPSLLVHGRPGLTFADNDELTQEFLRRECEPFAALPLTRDAAAHDAPRALDAITQATACARHFGVAASAIETRLRSELNRPDPPIEAEMLVQLLRTLEADPGAALARRCPAASSTP